MKESDTMSDYKMTFDVTAFRTWLESEADGGTIAETEPFLSAGYDHIDGEAGALIGHLVGLKQQQDIDFGWHFEGFISCTTAMGAEGDDIGAVIGVQAADRQALSVGLLMPGVLIGITEDQTVPGYEAAILAIESVTAHVNARLDNYERRDAAGPVDCSPSPCNY